MRRNLTEMTLNTSEASERMRPHSSYRQDVPVQNSALLKISLEGSYTSEQDLASSRGGLEESYLPLDVLAERVNETLANVSSGPLNETEGVMEGLVKEMPQEMMFNTSHIITISAYSCLMVLSALGNISVLRSIAGHRSRSLASRVTLMILHLTIADLLVTFLLMPLEIGWAWTVSWEAGDVACRILAFFRTFGVFLSGFLLVAISVDRYYSVLRPLTVMEAKRRVRLMLWMAWGASGVCSIPQTVIFHVEQHPDHPWFEQCVTFHSFPSPTYELLYNVAGFIAMYAIPLLTILFCYGSIVIVLYRKDVWSREAAGEERTPPSLGRTKTRTLHMTLIIVLVFFFCWTPYNIMSLWYFIDRKSAQLVDPRVQASLFIFAVANSTVNPLVYGYFNVRRGAKNPTPRQEWRMKRIVYKPPFRQHLPGCVCSPAKSSSSDLPCHIPNGYRTRYPPHPHNHYPGV
ncbi:gonadotropin-releasing hormone receptor [Procambarus clarkii]|uniref:gonadotropin-releasing hormone receptor n=1 Tax=Procambarus clarkii TaxID=6728 RepID=UPI001E67309B|nr:adipokinetic hormone/corazonin-related peptide receptor variant I-like [Procambarus clarkii]